MMKVKIITPAGLYNEYEVDKIHCTTTSGECSLLPNHMPFVATLRISHLILTIKGKDEEFAISGGLIQVLDNQARILIDTIEGRGEVDVDRAKKARERAQRRLAKLDANTSIKRAEVALEKALNRIKLFK